MKTLVIDWGNAGVFKVVDEKEAAGDQDLLAAVDATDCDIIKVESVRGDYQFRRALIDGVENEDTGETDRSITDWELLP